MPDATITVTTADAAPTSGPHKVSRVAGKDQAQVEITYSPDGGGDTIRYVEVKEIAGDGPPIRDHLGVMCGRGNRCGMSGSRPLASTANVERSFTVDDAELLVEGSYTYEALVRSDAGVN